MGHVFVKTVNDLDGVKMDKHTATGAAGDVVHSVGLDSDLHLLVSGHEGDLGVPAGLGLSAEDGTTAEVNADVAFLDLVQALESDKGRNNEDCEEKLYFH